MLTKLALAATTGLALAAPMADAAYPEKPVRLVVPFAAGGASDAAARAIAKSLARSLGQPVIIDNRLGANGAVAAQTVANATRDGHTLLWGVGSMAAIPLLQRNAPFESFGQFVPTSTAGSFAFGMFIPGSIPSRSVGEFVKLAQSQPDRMIYASATMSEYLAATQFMKAARIAMTRVPYKGGAQALPDLLANRVQVYFTPAGIALPYTKDARLRILGLLLPERSAAMPDVPTMAEAGLPSVSVPTWQAVVAPPKTAPEIASLLSAKINAALAEPEVREQFDRLFLRPEGSTPTRLAEQIARDIETWRTFIRENDIPQE